MELPKEKNSTVVKTLQSCSKKKHLTIIINF